MASAGVLAVAMTAAETTAYAQNGGVDTITVTARKRQENLQTVPIAITAMTGDMLEQRGAENIDDAARFAPNVAIGFASNGSGGGSNSDIFIRGIGQTDFLITTDPGVGLYIDDVYYARSIGTILDFLDVERIEILRGPQGTLFGRNTIGGAISLVSKRPADSFGGEIKATAGRFSHYSVTGSVDLPLSDQLKTRHTIYFNTEHGYTDRINVGDRLGDDEVIAGRSLLEWTPTDNFDALLSFDISHKEGGSANTAALSYDPTQGLAPLWQGLVGDPMMITTPVIVNPGNPFNSSATGPNVDDHDIWGVGGTLTWDLDWVSLKSITAYRSMEAEFSRDGDNSPVQYIQTHNFVDQNQFSQELQLSGDAMGGSLNWLLGGYYFDENATDQNDVRLASGLFDALEALPGAGIYLGGAPGTTCADFGIDPTVVCAGGMGNPVNVGFDVDFDIYNDIDTKSIAFFTHNTMDITDRFSVSGGFRWSKDEKTYFLEHLRVNSGAPIIPATTVEDEWSAFLPKASVGFQATDRTFLYASASRGFKSGGFNGRPTTTAEVGSFAPEFVWAYETGVKTEFFDRRLVVNTSLFYYDYKDIQLNIVSADTTGNLVLIVENAGEARTIGVEAEFEARPNEYFSFDGGIGFLDAEYNELNPGATIALTNELARSPNWTANLGVNFEYPISNDWIANIRGDWSYRGDHFIDSANTPELYQEGVSLFNARLALVNDSGGWTVAVYGTNLTNELYLTGGVSAVSSFGHVEGVFGSPRRWGVSVKKSF
ncbi:TonB-dependent receptor [Hyphococcus sp. DH-69]|uniref:TonB-dependent receptor n=1 Tax=Hyphococcus formosus TaxID=3143534 RepID=UPI00398B864E